MTNRSESRESCGDECCCSVGSEANSLQLGMQDKDGSDHTQSNDHSPVHSLESRLTVEANEDPGEERAQDEGQDSNVIEAKKERRDRERMVHERMVAGRKYHGDHSR